MILKTGRWIDILSIGGIAIAIYLVVNEIIVPGYCPRYPVIDVPACYLVLVFFIAVFISGYIKIKLLARILFHSANIAGLITAIWFSSNHLMGNLHCPVLIGIPLCYAALLTFITLIVIGIAGKFEGKKINTNEH